MRRTGRFGPLDGVLDASSAASEPREFEAVEDPQAATRSARSSTNQPPPLLRMGRDLTSQSDPDRRLWAVIDPG